MFYHLVLVCLRSLNHYPFVVSVAIDETFETSKAKCGGSYIADFEKCSHVGVF